MISLIQKLLTKAARWFDDDKEDMRVIGYENASSIKSAHVSSTASSLDMDGLNFMIFGATGGKVIQTTVYDNRTGNMTRRLHIITDDMNLGEELELIITRERLGS